MSRWWPEPSRIALAPGEVALAGAGGVRVLSTASRRAEDLLPLVDGLLSDANTKPRRVDIVLSQHFVRHVITPPPGKGLSRDEEAALVAASLHDVYGSESAGWRVAVHSQPPHAGLVGAAADGEWLDRIEALLGRHGCRLGRIVPAARLGVSRLPRRYSGWWLAVEPGWATLFGATHGVWRHQAALPIGDDWHEVVSDWVVREAESSSVPIASRLDMLPLGIPESAPLEIAGWQCERVKHDAQLRGAAALTTGTAA